MLVGGSGPKTSHIYNETVPKSTISWYLKCAFHGKCVMFLWGGWCQTPPPRKSVLLLGGSDPPPRKSVLQLGG